MASKLPVCTRKGLRWSLCHVAFAADAKIKKEKEGKWQRCFVFCLLSIRSRELIEEVDQVTYHVFSTRYTCACYLLPVAIRVEWPIADGFVDDNVAVTDLNVVKTRGVRTNPRLVLDGSSLAAEIRKRNQITFTTLATPRKCILHEIASFLLTRDSIRPPDHTTLVRFDEK